MTQRPLFISPWLKVERAHRHIHEFHSVLKGFLQTDFYRAGVERDAKTGRYVFKCSMVNRLPADLPLSMGDAVHNMRSALDHLAMAIIRRANVSAKKDAYFPFDETRDGLVARLDNGPIKKACPGIEEIILDEIQPYRAGKTPLWEMNRLDNIDKHNLLIPAVYATQLMVERLKVQNGVMRHCLLRLEPGGVINLFGSNQEFEVEGEIHPSFDVIFPKAAPFEEQPVLPTLIQVVESVSEAIHIVEDFVRTRHPDWGDAGQGGNGSDLGGA
jgi:hypothetical protein